MKHWSHSKEQIESALRLLGVGRTLDYPTKHARELGGQLRMGLRSPMTEDILSKIYLGTGGYIGSRR